MVIGLRIDVDTLRGTRDGVLPLCDLLKKYSLHASFFFSVGPDNMGRHLWRLWRPSFLYKMVRSGAPSLYGWDIVMRGTLWSGPVIGARCSHVIRSVLEAGHEVGIHAWDHHAWQSRIERMNADAIEQHLSSGIHMLRQITGVQPSCSAAPAWKTCDAALLRKERFPFTYSSDCRGHSVFRPIVHGKVLSQPQIPVTLPTYDELIGRHGISDHNYNEFLMSCINPEGLNVLAIHAEVEGISRIELFNGFVHGALKKRTGFAPLGSLIGNSLPVGHDSIVRRKLVGRQGWVSCQAGMADPGSFHAEPPGGEGRTFTVPRCS